MLLFDNPKFSDNGNSDIIYTVNEIIESTTRFSESIYDQCNSKYFLFSFYFLSLLYFLS